MIEDKDKEIGFVASRYKQGRFDVNKGWKRLNIAPSIGLKRIRIAAAIAAVVVMTATAAVIYRHASVPETQIEAPQTTVDNPKTVVKVVDFENASLTEVVKKIKEVYGVEVINLPENTDEYHLSLRFEGNPVELVDAINDILDTKMEVK